VAGWTLGKLKQAKTVKLAGLGLSSEFINQIQSEQRPPIPKTSLTRVLFANRFQCCVCRSPEKPIIVHHIDPWAQTHDHSEANLAVLCVEDHIRVHSKSDLSQNLDSTSLKNFKTEWEDRVATLDAQAIVQASRLESCNWNYFNHLRLFELAQQLNVNLRARPFYQVALGDKIINADGTLRPRNPKFSYMYNDRHTMTLYGYVKDVMDATLKRLSIQNISDHLDKGTLLPIIATGDYIFVQGAHVFKPLDKVRSGKGQPTVGTRRAHGVEVKFVFDRWEGTSCSSWACWLSGRQAVGSLIQVKGIERSDGVLSVAGTVIGIATGLTSLKTRDYAPQFGGLSFITIPIPTKMIMNFKRLPSIASNNVV